MLQRLRQSPLGEAEGSDRATRGIGPGECSQTHGGQQVNPHDHGRGGEPGVGPRAVGQLQSCAFHGSPRRAPASTAPVAALAGM